MALQGDREWCLEDIPNDILEYGGSKDNLITLDVVDAGPTANKGLSPGEAMRAGTVKTTGDGFWEQKPRWQRLDWSDNCGGTCG